MRAIVLLFLTIACLSIGFTAYFALSFTMIEAFLVTIVALLASVVLIEGMFRRRAETYLVQQTEEIARQLATMAKTTELVSDQVSFLSGLNLKERTDNLEADVSVLGTVVRQLAEAVAEMEEAQAALREKQKSTFTPETQVRPTGGIEVINPPGPPMPIEMVQEALAKNQLEQYMQPIVTLPQRRTLGYELMPKLIADDGTLHHAEEFLHHDDLTGTISQLERFMTRQAANIVHRANITGGPTTLFVPISRALLRNQEDCEAVIGIFQSNRAVAVSIMLMIPEPVYNVLTGSEKQALDAMVKAGAGVCLDEVTSLRLSFQQLSERGVKYIKVDAPSFIADPLQFSDYHRADIADYIERFGVGLIMDNITQEDQVLELLDDKIPFAQGKHIAPASPVRPDLAGQSKADTRLAAR